MGFWERLTRGTEEKPGVRIGFIGDGPDADLLRKGYERHPQAEIISAEPIARSDEVIRSPGIHAIEVFASPGDSARVALACLKAGIHTSVPAPLAMSLEKADELIETARNYELTLRVRQQILYYDPVIKAKDLIKKRAIGRPITLKLMLKVTGMDKPDFDRAEWLIENQTSYLALAEDFLGPVEKIHARLEANQTNGIPCSNVVAWKYCEKHQYGYLQVDFTPGLHVRTFTDPIYRAVEITGTDGVMFINRAEGQLLRQPVLVVRAKDKTIVHEMLKDDWREVFSTMARDMVRAVIENKQPRSNANSSRNALLLALAAKDSIENGREVLLT